MKAERTNDLSKLETDPTPSQSLSAKSWASALDKLGRVLLCGAIVWAAVFCLSTVREMRESERRRESQNAEKAATDAADPIVALMNGNWVFTDIPWSIHISTLPESEARRRLQADIPSFEIRQQVEGSETLLSLLDMFKASKSLEGSNYVYRVDSDSIEAIAFAPSQMPDQLQLVRVVQLNPGADCGFLEVKPMLPSPETQSNPNALLLPRNPDDERIAVRYDSDGRLCAEMVQLHSSLEELLSLWTQLGWTVTTPGANLRNAAAIPEIAVEPTAAMHICTKGEESISVIAPTVAEQLPRTLLIIKSFH